jgi:hypothetical protein
MVVLLVFFMLVVVVAVERRKQWDDGASELRFHAGPAKPMLTVFLILSTICAFLAGIMMIFS